MDLVGVPGRVHVDAGVLTLLQLNGARHTQGSHVGGATVALLGLLGLGSWLRVRVRVEVKVSVRVTLRVRTLVEPPLPIRVRVRVRVRIKG